MVSCVNVSESLCVCDCAYVRTYIVCVSPNIMTLQLEEPFVFPLLQCERPVKGLAELSVFLPQKVNISNIQNKQHAIGVLQ